MRDPQRLELLSRRLVDLEEGAYQEFATIFGPLLVRYFVRHGLPYFEAEDLAATCVTDIAMKTHKYQPGGNFSAWVFAIARNRLSDHHKRALSKSEPTDELAVASIPESWPDLEVELEVQTALADLTECDRVLVFGRALGTRSYKDLAKDLGISEEAARVRYLRARRSLEARLLQTPAVQKRIERSRKHRGIA